MLPTQEFERQEGFWITIKPNALSLFTGTRDQQISSLGNYSEIGKQFGYILPNCIQHFISPEDIFETQASLCSPL